MYYLSYLFAVKWDCDLYHKREIIIINKDSGILLFFLNPRYPRRNQKEKKKKIDLFRFSTQNKNNHSSVWIHFGYSFLSFNFTYPQIW